MSAGPEEALYSCFVRVEYLNWISIPEPEDCVRVQAKLRYRQREQWAVIRPAKDGAVVLEFDVPQRAVTPGQAAVFYDGDLVVGGGTIVSAWNREEEAAE